MTIFSETYNSYYQIMRSLLTQNPAVSLRDLRTSIEQQGFAESLLYILPKITSGEWGLFEKNGEIFYSKISENFYTPLTKLQKSYIKSILMDEKMQLFLEPAQREELLHLFHDTPVLWQPEDFHYYDRFLDGDDFSQPAYQQNFRTILEGIRQNCYIDLEYCPGSGRRTHHHYIPARLEYSIRNDMFRLLALKPSGSSRPARLEIFNLNRIQSVSLMEKKASGTDTDALIRSTYYKEPVHLRIYDRRNALERAMLQFANYEKNTFQVGHDTYECLIYYNEKMETELLIEVLSFGPMIEVLGNERFLWQIKRRLYRQAKLQTI